MTIVFAIWSIYCIDFSINAGEYFESYLGRRPNLGVFPVQAADRALLVDILPPSQQEVGNAWAGRMFGLGSVAGFFVYVMPIPSVPSVFLENCICFSRGNVDLTKSLAWLGKTQLQVLSVLTSLSLIGAHGITSAGVTEKVLLKESNQYALSSCALLTIQDLMRLL